MRTLPHPSTSKGNGARPASPRPRPDTAASGPWGPAGRVSRLDRITLQLGVAVAVVIAVCSYAVSATSLYALGVQAGYSWWQAAAVPVVADGPAIYGMFRIVSRSRRHANGVGYGWLLVIAGTLASIGGNVAHAQPDLVAQAIAAAIPLAVLAMLEGLKGDAAEVTRLTSQAAAAPAQVPGGLDHSAGSKVPAIDTVSVRRTDLPASTLAGRLDGRRKPELAARPVPGGRPGSASGSRRPMTVAGPTASPGRPGAWPRPAAVAAAAPPASSR